MSRGTDWRQGGAREVKYSPPELQHQTGGSRPGSREDMRGLPQPAADYRLPRKPDLAPGRPASSPALPDLALGNLGRPLGSPVLSILAKGRRLAPEVAANASQQHEHEQRPAEGFRERPRRSVSYDSAADSRSASPADVGRAQPGRPAQDGSLSRLARQKPHRQPLAPVELPPVLPARAARLHKEILEFCRRVVPDAEEDVKRSAAHGAMQAACAAVKLFKVQPFGSRASWLELWDSDIDLVVLGVVKPSGENHTFFEAEREEVNFHLARLCKQLRLTGSLQKMHHIKRARVPIVKCTVVHGIDVDVSINADRGITAARWLCAQGHRYYGALWHERAARWLLRCQKQWPALRPLTLLLKAIMRVLELHDVSQGGLGSFSLSNMAIAHLQEEEKEGRDTADLGVLLLSFLMRFGGSFDYDAHAVSVGQGGVIPRAALDTPIASGHIVQLVVEDIDTKRDVAGGSYRMGDVAVTFAGAAASCEKVLCGAGTPSDSLLADIFGDCCIKKAVSREPVNCDPWAAWDPLPSPDSARRQLPNGLSDEPTPGPTNGLHQKDLGTQDRLQLLSQLESSRKPGMRAKRTAVFLDPSSRSSLLQWGKPKYGEGHADSILLAEHPSLPMLAVTPLGAKADLSVVGTADDGQVQILVIELPQRLESSSSVAPHFAVSVSDEASTDAAGELAESIAAGHRQGIALELFPQPRILQGTVGVELESGYMFFQPEELRKFWESQDAGAESETDSILAADEEGLGHLHVQAMAAKDSMGFFGSLPAAANREQGANKRKSMDLGGQPAQPELRQSDRWVEGHDPELFNLRRKMSKDDALDSILLPPQNAGSGRSAPRSQAALPPQKDLPPHLLDQGASRQADSAKPGNAAKAGGASRTFSTEWPSLGRQGMQPAQEARRAAAESRPPGAGKGTETLLSNSLAKDMGRQRSMTLGKLDGRTLADFMPQAQAGSGRRADRARQAGGKGQPHSRIAGTQAFPAQGQSPAPDEDLPPHLRQR